MSEEKGENSVVNFSNSVEGYEEIQENGQNEDLDSKNYETLSEIDDTYSQKKDIKDLYSDENSKSFTVRELLDREDQEEQNAMENGTQNGGLFTGVTIYQGNNSDNNNKNNNASQEESAGQQPTNQQRMAADLLNNVVEGDEEGRSRQRILAFAAKRYASAIERNPNDYDALYNWALVLQECADNVGSEPGSPSKDALLEEACKKYDEATRLCPTLHDAYYNWAIAISDQAKMRGRTKEAENLWKQATRKYEKAVQLNRNSPQALNNWGLALQELSAIVPAREKLQIVKMAVSKFRAAIQLQFDFHRAIYNLGTVLYGLAEDILRSGRSINSKEMSPNELYTQSAVYIAAAHSLRPNYPVYRSALRLVKSMLPLPYLKAGYLIAPPAGDNLAPHSDWKQAQFVLNHEGLYEIADSRTQSNSDRSAVMMLSNNSSIFKIEIADILSLSPCSDLTLPPGSGFCIETVHGPQYLLAETWESMDCWLDAIRLVYTISARGKSDVLAGVITS